MALFLLVVGGVLLGVLLFWEKLKTVWPFSQLVGTTAGNLIDAASGKATDVLVTWDFTKQVMLCWVHDDLDTMAKLKEIEKIMKAWDTPAIDVASTPTTDTLAVEIASLKAAITAMAPAAPVTPTAGGTP